MVIRWPRRAWQHNLGAAATVARYVIAYVGVILLLYFQHVGLPYD